MDNYFLVFIFIVLVFITIIYRVMRKSTSKEYAQQFSRFSNDGKPKTSNWFYKLLKL